MKVPTDKKDLFLLIEKCLQNAQELFEEAMILFENKKSPRAFSLFQLSIEEIGKTALIYSFIKEEVKSEIIIEKFWKDFTNHKIKTKKSISYDKMFEFILPDITNDKKLIKDYSEEILNLTSKVHLSNEYKNFSLYTSFYDNWFYLPSELITEDLIFEIKNLCQIRLNISKQFYKISKTKIEEF